MKFELSNEEVQYILEILKIQILISINQQLFENAEQLRAFKKNIIAQRDMQILLNQFADRTN